MEHALAFKESFDMLGSTMPFVVESEYLEKQHRRSFHEGEIGLMLAILEDAVYANRRLPRGLTVEQAIAKLNAIGISTPSEGTAIIRAARDSR